MRWCLWLVVLGCGGYDEADFVPAKTDAFCDLYLDYVDPASLVVLRVLFGLLATIGATRFLVKFQHLRHGGLPHLPTMARTSRLVRIKRSSPSMVTSVPPYFEYKTVSPSLIARA